MQFFNNNYESKQFSDRILSEDDKKIIDAPMLHGSSTNVDKGHTLVDYEDILNNGLLAYQKKIDKELQAFSDDEYLLAMKSVLESIKKLIDKMLNVANENVNCCKNAIKNIERRNRKSSKLCRPCCSQRGIQCLFQ